MIRKRIKKDGKIIIPQRLVNNRKKRMEPQIETGSGFKVRSQYEKTCVDFFIENKIKFQYEPLMLLDGKQYRPDFFLEEHNLFIELCGLSHLPHYRDRTKHKKQIYKKNKLKVCFIEYSGKGSLKKILSEQLKEAGLKL